MFKKKTECDNKMFRTHKNSKFAIEHLCGGEYIFSSDEYEILQIMKINNEIVVVEYLDKKKK